MALRVSLVFCLIITLAGCAAQGTMLPSPGDVKITHPSQDLPPELAAFSGIWEGVWDGVLLSRLIVERIDSESARVIYIWDDSPGYFKAGWSRYLAKVFPGGKLEFGSSERMFIFRMARDRMSIEGERVVTGGRINTVIMKKILP